jgi:His/Glu/Gln/Arg/opine family amino acid ABC transporter permease subunit
MDLAFTVERVIPHLIDGLWLTILIFLATLVCGNALALPIALARISDNVLLRGPAWFYILFLRGTPLIVQIFMIYYGLAQFAWVRHSILWVVLKDPIWCAVIAISLNTGAYSGEVLRGAIQAVPKGEIEAGRAYGMSNGLVMRRITLPLALRIALPMFGNEAVLLMKATAIVFTITVRDLMGEANIIRAQTFRTYEPLVTAAALYLMLTFIISRVFAFAERRMAAGRAGMPANAADAPPVAKAADPPAATLGPLSH